MKKSINPFRISLLAVLFFSLIFVACEGPAGKDGATGATGPQGPAGPKGDPGQSGAEQCGVCHNNGTSLFEKKMQWAYSLHGTGDIYIYGNRVGCAQCHTHHGFLEYITTGATASAPYSEPATINCRTCHKIHENYDETDWAITKTNDVVFYETAGKATANFGKGNLCGQCHQALPTSPAIDVNSSADYLITSLRFGAHHSPAANLYANTIAFAPKGSKTYPTTNVHASVADACVSCHMSEGPVAHGEPVGGHTFRMSTEDGTVVNYKSCQGCHSEVTSKFNDKEGFYEAFKADLMTADSLFVAKGWRNASGYWIANGKNASATNPLVVSQNQAAAAYAYQLLLEDKSNGIHNPKYARAVLDNILEELRK